MKFIVLIGFALLLMWPASAHAQPPPYAPRLYIYAPQVARASDLRNPPHPINVRATDLLPSVNAMPAGAELMWSRPANLTDIQQQRCIADSWSRGYDVYPAEPQQFSSAVAIGCTPQDAAAIFWAEVADFPEENCAVVSTGITYLEYTIGYRCLRASDSGRVAHNYRVAALVDNVVIFASALDWPDRVTVTNATAQIYPIYIRINDYR